MNRIKRLTSCLVITLMSLYCTSSYAITPSIQELRSIDFGQIVPKSGFCEIDPADGSLTTTNKVCIGGTQLAHYRITADPNSAIRIRFNEVIDADLDVQYQPTARMENNLGTTTLWYFTGSTTTVTTGTDGVIDIYVGGRLRLNSRLSSSTAYQLSFDVDFNYP